MSNDKQSKIKELEALANEVLNLKKTYRQRRPIIIEFCGCPKAGKTSSITALNIFLKRNGFKTVMLSERANVCPISDKQSPIFNVWTITSTINQINALIDNSNSSCINDIDVVLCDRGIFDALCWFRWLKNNNRMDTKEYKTLIAFTMLDRWQRNIDLIYVFLTTPKESINREYAHLLTNKRGSIMDETILAQYEKAVKQTIKKYSKCFRALQTQDTTGTAQDVVNYKITHDTLNVLKEMLVEKIGYLEKSCLDLKDGLNDYSQLKPKLENIKYDSRDLVEKNSDFIQPIAVATIISEDENKIFCVFITLF